MGRLDALEREHAADLQPHAALMNPRAPSVQRAHVRVQWAWYASIPHALLLAGFGVHHLTRDPPVWGLGLLCLVGAGLVPVLGRATYRGYTLSAHLLLASVVVPPVVAFFTGRSLVLPLLGLPLMAIYFMGVKGVLGLRGRRRSQRAGPGRKARRR